MTLLSTLLGDFAHVPDPMTTQYKVMLGVYAMLIPGLFIRELKDTSGYSKFFAEQRRAISIGSRLGMTLLYTPALISNAYLAKTAEPVAAGLNLAPYLGMMQFAKRLFEVYFVHKYSGSMSLDMIIPGSIMYAFISGTIVAASVPLPVTAAPSIVGLTAFAIGSFGNLYHHYLLRALRTGDEKKYVVPRGGLFEYVACPHYLFEIIAWVGMAAYGRSLLGYVAFLPMFGYLAGRSIKTTEYYQKKLGDEYPKSRRHLIPFLF